MLGEFDEVPTLLLMDPEEAIPILENLEKEAEETSEEKEPEQKPEEADNELTSELKMLTSFNDNYDGLWKMKS